MFTFLLCLPRAQVNWLHVLAMRWPSSFRGGHSSRPPVLDLLHKWDLARLPKHELSQDMLLALGMLKNGMVSLQLNVWLQIPQKVHLCL